MNALAVSAVGLLLASTAACSTDQSADATLTVYAAASLTESFTTIGEEFEAANPGVTVRFNFGGSSNLAAQIQQGAPADVFASANPANMVAAAEPVDFATNTLQIVTPPDNPAGVTSLADLARDDVAVVLCAPAVPCGDAALQVARAAGIIINPVSEEQSVTDALNKVVTGEADAALVYVTDVSAAGDSVLGIAFPEANAAVNRYPIAALNGSQHPDLAQAFTDFVTGPEGQQILRAAGFGAP